MTEHLPECPMLKPCCDNEEFPEHGFCIGDFNRCLHCMAECICDRLRQARDRGYSEACDDGWGEPEHIKEALNAAAQRVMELPDLSDAGFSYMGLLSRAVVLDAIKGES